MDLRAVRKWRKACTNLSINSYWFRSLRPFGLLTPVATCSQTGLSVCISAHCGGTSWIGLTILSWYRWTNPNHTSILAIPSESQAFLLTNILHITAAFLMLQFSYLSSSCCKASMQTGWLSTVCWRRLLRGGWLVFWLCHGVNNSTSSWVLS